MNVTRKHAGTPFEAGTRVRVAAYSPLPDVYVIAEVVWIEAGTSGSKFDTYRLATEAGEPIETSFTITRANLRKA